MRDVPVGSAMGAMVATRGTDRQVGPLGALAATALGGLAGMVVWENMPGEMIPEDHDAQWRRGVAAAIATDVLVSAIIAYAF